MIVEVTGTPDKIDALEQLLRKYGIIEMTRTGESPWLEEANLYKKNNL